MKQTTMEDDDRLRELFADYRPDLPDTDNFMLSLNRRLEAVEEVKKQLDTDRRASRRSAILAALAGFAAGLLTVLLFPYIRIAFDALLPSAVAGQEIGDTLAWIVVGLVAAGTSLSTFLPLRGRT